MVSLTVPVRRCEHAHVARHCTTLSLFFFFLFIHSFFLSLSPLPASLHAPLPPQARFLGPHGVCTDDANLYVADNGNYRVRVVSTATGDASTLAGSGVKGSTNGVGSAAKFDNIRAMAIDLSTRVVYVSEYSLQKIRAISPLLIQHRFHL